MDSRNTTRPDEPPRNASGRSRRRTLWRVTWMAAALLSLAAFTPLVIPAGTYEPMIAGVPYTLWVGILVTVALVFLTYAATRLYPPGEDTDDTDRKPPETPNR
jgi:multidrug efflux pump subunit AcrB